MSQDQNGGITGTNIFVSMGSQNSAQQPKINLRQDSQVKDNLIDLLAKQNSAL